MSGATRVLPGEVGVLAAEVSVVSRVGVDGSEQVEFGDDRCRAQVEHIGDGTLDLLFGTVPAPNVLTNSPTGSDTPIA